MKFTVTVRQVKETAYQVDAEDEGRAVAKVRARAKMGPQFPVVRTETEYRAEKHLE